MRTYVASFGVSLGLMISTLGCSTSLNDDAVQRAGQASIATNGLHLNGLHLNGLHLNGLHLNGLHLNGLHASSVRLSGAIITAYSDERPVASKADLIGATINTTADDGTSFVIHIDDVVPTDQDDLVLYALSYTPPGGTAAVPLCDELRSGTRTLAIALTGTWNNAENSPHGGTHENASGEITFACQGYALAKCVEFGYAPWRTATECKDTTTCQSLSLAPFHQACTRMLRADYCGIGTPSTHDGTTIDVWDNIGIQTDDAPTQPFEAEWGVDGALCVRRPRLSAAPSQEDGPEAVIRRHCPERWNPTTCGGSESTFFSSQGFTTPLTERSLLRTRAPTP